MASQTQTLSSTHWMSKPQAVSAMAKRRTIPLVAGAGGNPEFFAVRSIRELAQSQGVVPVRDIKVFAGGISSEENLDEMLDEIYRSREP